MKGFVLFLLMVSFFANLAAQSKGDSRFAGALPAEDDTAYVDALNKKSVENYLRNPDSSRALSEKALILAKQFHYNRGTGISYASIGYTYWAQSCHSLSLYYLFNAIEYLKATKEYAGLSMCYRLIARNYTDLKEYGAAAQYLKEAETNAALSKDNFTIELVYNESSFLALQLGNYDKAWATAKTGLYLCSKNKDTLLKGIIYSRLANILKKTGKAEQAKSYFDSAFTWSLLSHNNRLRAYLFINYAENYLAAGITNSTLAMAEAASNLADTIGNADVKLSAASLMAKAYSSSKDPNLALAYERNYSKLQDSVRHAGAEKSFMLLQQFLAMNKREGDMEVHERESAMSKERLRLQHTIIIALVIFAALLMAGLLTILYLYKEKKRLAEQLADRNSAVTEQKNIIEQQSQNMLELNNLKTKLFAVISHDLRAPISNLRSIMAMFQQHDLTENQAVALLKRMLPALDATDLTLSNLLNWSMKQMNGLRVNKSSVPLLPMAEEVKQVFEFALQQKNIALHVNVKEESRVYSDEQHLKIVLRNLVSNAIKFTPENGTIIIGEGAGAGKAIIYIKDTGQGIKPADIGKLFAATTNFTTRGTQGEKGTGLGLVLCKDLIELNKGTISVESIPGQGSTFYIQLPETES